MQRSTQKNGLINLLTLLAMGVAGYAVARLVNSLAGQAGMFFLGIGVLVAAVSWFQMRLEENERLEKLELDELAKARSTATLFENKDAGLFPAQRLREQFEKYFVPAFTTVLFIIEAVGAFMLWRWVSRTELAAIREPMVGLSLFGLFALILFLLGKFSATVARIENLRLLRASASWLLVGAYLFALIAIGVAGVKFELVRADHYVAKALAVLLGVLAFETLITLLLEIYRPRVKGKVGRPLYDSRLVGLLGQPEGLITTAAQALDYQFGFKISETWLYRGFATWLPWVISAQIGLLLLSTTVVFIEPGEQALLEHRGRPAEGRPVIGPGAHVKWPWPIDRVYRYRTDQIQSFNVGFTPETNALERTVLWTVAHSKEENFLVANREQNATTNDVAGRRTPPVSLLTVSIPVHFQITNLTSWAYNNESPTDLLQDLATREVVRYLVSADLNEIMSRRRQESAEALRERIQASANERQLGASIVFVGLQDIHPPVSVAPEYEKVVGATQTKQARILSAYADGIRTNALAMAQATSITNRAIADRVQREIGAIARANLFTNQIPAYRAAPSIYMDWAYLRMFGRVIAPARKYVVLGTNTHDVIQFDLQDPIRSDLLESLRIPENPRR